MKSISRLSVLSLAFLTLIFVSAGCQRDPQKPLRLGYLIGDLHHLPALVALEQDLFARHGLKVKVAGVFPAGPEEMTAFRAGELDIGYVGIAPLVSSAANAETRARIIALVNEEGSALAVPASSPFQSLSDLAGKLVAIPGYSTVQDLLLQIALEKNKLGPKAIKTMVVKPPEMGEALRQGSVSGFIAWEPYPTMAVQKGEARILLTSRQIWPRHPCCVFIATEKLLHLRPGIGAKLGQIHREAIEYINSNPEDAVKIAARRTGIEEKVIRAALPRIIYNPEVDREGLKRYIGFLSRNEYIKIQDPEQFLNQLLPPG